MHGMQGSVIVSGTAMGAALLERRWGLTIKGTKTYAKGQPSSSSGLQRGRMPPLATCAISANEYRPRTFT